MLPVEGPHPLSFHYCEPDLLAGGSDPTRNLRERIRTGGGLSLWWRLGCPCFGSGCFFATPSSLRLRQRLATRRTLSGSSSRASESHYDAAVALAAREFDRGGVWFLDLDPVFLVTGRTGYRDYSRLWHIGLSTLAEWHFISTPVVRQQACGREEFAL